MGKRGRRPQVRWWDRQGGGFFCTLMGRKVALVVPCEDDSPDGPNYRAALDAWTKLLRQGEGKGTDSYALGSLLTAYRQMLKDAGRKSTLHNTESYLRSFAVLHGERPICDIRSYDVREWLTTQTGWGPSSKRLAVARLQAALNWGAREGLIDNNPLKGRVEAPRDKPRGREARLAPEFAALLISQARDDLAMLLRMLRGTGARPEEVEQATAANFLGDRIAYRWDAREGYIHKQAKRGKREDRVIFLTPELAALCQSQAAKFPTGPIFRTRFRKGWTTPNRQAHWSRLLKQPAVAAYMRLHGIKRKDVVPYSFRHTWISEWLDSGRSIKLCADLCGTSVAMIERHYGHTDEANLKAVYLGFMAATTG